MYLCLSAVIFISAKCHVSRCCNGLSTHVNGVEVPPLLPLRESQLLQVVSIKYLVQAVIGCAERIDTHC